MFRFITVLILALGAATVPWTGVRAERYALLVGVSEYPALDKDLQLEGPRNDIPLIRTVLQARGFEPQRIAVLADGVSGALPPTRAAIFAAFDDLLARLKPGDYVYLHFAGHGSQQPVDPSASEPDGLAEIFLPRDIGKWDGSEQAVRNAIADSELVQRLDALRSRGAFVWAVFDACHSATLMRGLGGPDGLRYRRVRPTDLGVPAERLARAVESAPRMRGGGEAKPAAAHSEADGGFVAFYAAQTTEETPEMRLPAGHPKRRSMGLFSFTVSEALASLPDGTTYRQLAQHVLNRYAAQNLASPTPLFTGSHLDAPVFGSQAAARVLQWRIQKSSGLSIAAGALHGLANGALAAVVPGPLSGNEEAIGYVRLADVDVFQAKLELVAHAGKPALAPSKVPDGAFARVLEQGTGAALRVAGPLAKTKNGSEVPLRTGSVAEAIAALRSRESDGPPVQWVSPDADPDLLLLVDAGQLWLQPRGASLVKSGPLKTHSVRLGPAEVLEQAIDGSLRAIGKVSSLLRLSSSIAGTPASKSLEVAIHVDAGSAQIVATPDTLPTLKSGDRVSAVLRNRGSNAIDVTILYIDSSYGITTVFPTSAGAANRIESGATLKLALGEVDETTVGTERLLVIAVEARSGDESYDFAFLAQPRLVRTRSVMPVGEQEITRLLREAAFTGKTRGLKPAVAGRLAMRLFSWRVEASR